MKRNRLGLYNSVVLVSILMIVSSITISVESLFATDVDEMRWIVMMDSNDDYGIDAFQHLKDIGVQAVLEDIRWSSFEPSNGSFDFSGVSTHRQYCNNVGLEWFPQIAIHYVPSWLYVLDAQYYYYDKNGDIADATPPNYCHPNTYYYVDRAVNAFIDHYYGQVPFLYISSGQWGESYYPDGDNFYAFDNNTIAAWRSYTGNSSAIPYSSTTSGSGGTLQEFYDFWYGKMHDYISHTHQLAYSSNSTIPQGLKISANEDLGQDIDKQTQAALPYNLRVISHGGPLSQTIAAQTLGSTASSNNINAWEESFLRTYQGNTNTFRESRGRLYTYGINGYMYATMFNLLNYRTGGPPNGPQEEFYRYKKLIDDCGFGFETWDTGFWTTEITGSGACGATSSYIKEGNYSLHLSVGGGGDTAAAYKEIKYNVTDSGITYPDGDVVLDGWRYLATSNDPSSLYWVVEGYDTNNNLKVHATYWAGVSDPANEPNTYQDTGLGRYYLKTQLDDSGTTAQWIRTTKMVNQDIDDRFGSGTWSSLAIKKIRIINKAWGAASCEGYFDEVKITNTLPYGINDDFEYGNTKYWHTSGYGLEVSDTLVKKGDYSLHVTHTGSIPIETYQDYVYSSGPVVLNAWHYMVSCGSSTSIYWKILGYGADESLKFTGIYWYGFTAPSDSSDFKIQLSNSSVTGRWVNDIRTINEDFGQSAWNELGITKLRFEICTSGYSDAEFYIDDVQLKARGPSVWYMAEGATYDGFDEFICIQNPGSNSAKIIVTFMRQDGDPVQIAQTLSPTSRTTLKVNNYGFKDSVSTKVECTNGVNIIAERPMYYYSTTSAWECGHCSQGVIGTDTTWYLAEGCTNGFDEWVLIQNPNNSPAVCRLTFMKSDGSTVLLEKTIARTSRESIHVNTYVSNADVSTKVESINGVGIIVERAMYWDGDGYHWGGGHDSVGVNSPNTTWYLAEGSTDGFDEWILIQNPSSETAHVKVTFMRSEGRPTITREYDIRPTSRDTIYVNRIISNESISAKVESTNGVGIIAERAMYWPMQYPNSTDPSGWTGGHNGIGVTSPASVWYLAEGATLGSFDEYICIQNPNSDPAECTVTFMKSDASTVTQTITVPATGRYTIHVNSVVPNAEISTKVESTNGVEIIVERAMYWDANGTEWADGHCSTGISL